MANSINKYKTELDKIPKESGIIFETDEITTELDKLKAEYLKLLSSDAEAYPFSNAKVEPDPESNHEKIPFCAPSPKFTEFKNKFEFFMKKIFDFLWERIKQKNLLVDAGV